MSKAANIYVKSAKVGRAVVGFDPNTIPQFIELISANSDFNDLVFTIKGANLGDATRIDITDGSWSGYTEDSTKWSWNESTGIFAGTAPFNSPPYPREYTITITTPNGSISFMTDNLD